MGGGGGGSLSRSDIAGLEAKAKMHFEKASEDVVRHVFISFAYEDLGEVNLLRGQAKNDKLDLEFDDYSLKDPIDSKNADYIKCKIREKIDRSSVTVVYLTSHSASSSWVNWEIRESLVRGKGVIGVYKDNLPSELPSVFRENNCRAVKWNHKELMDAIEGASVNR